MVSACPSCGAPVEEGKRYCGDCGAPLAAPGDAAAAGIPSATLPPVGRPLAPAVLPGVSRPLVSPAAKAAQPVSERRVCTVLFADLVGFTPLSESRDSEDVRSILSRYFEVSRTIIGRYGGIVEKFIGDAVMAVWGTPVADEGDTERAVRAALDLVAAVASLGAEVAAPGLAARAGLVTGEVAVSIGATGEGMVAGDAVNTASRVQSVAGAGCVFVDEATRRLSESAVAFDDEGFQELKGKEVPEHLYRAVRVLSGVGGSERPDGLEAPLTGRDAELRTLKELFHASADRRAPRLVVVAGAAGVGKSRLGWEFFKYIDGLADTVLWHRGRCLSYGEGVAFWALAEIVRQRFGIAEEDTTEASAQKLAEGMIRFVGDENEREYVGLRLAKLLGTTYGKAANQPPLPREELFAGWRLFFERLAAVAPVALLVEDAQHADSALLEFFAYLIDWTRELPIVVLFFTRPGLAPLDSGYGIGRNRSTLSIDPLDLPSMEALVESLVPDMPTEARHAITAQAEGIPLFAVETVRSLIDRGVVVPTEGTYRLVGDIGTLSVPETLHALLAARLDSLTPEVRDLVGDASVLGSSFPREALVAVSGKTAAAVTAGLAELVRRDVLEVSADILSPQRGSYRFGQEMLRQVAYQTLSRRDRKVRHLAVAVHLRSTFANDGEEIGEVIGRHYIDAIAAGPDDDDAQANAGEAISFLVRAGERSQRSGAPGRAARSYAEAARISEPEDPSLWERAARASYEYGDSDGSLGQMRRAREGYLAIDDTRKAACCQSEESRCLVDLGQLEAAVAAVSASLEVLRSEPDEDTVGGIRGLAGIEAQRGNQSAANALAEEALALGQEVDLAGIKLARLFIMAGIVRALSNRRAEAAAYYGEAARLAERVGDLAVGATALLDLADVTSDTDPALAAEAAARAVDQARRTGRHIDLGYAVSNLTVSLLEVGRWDEAATVVDETVELVQVGSELMRCTGGWLAALRGDLPRASAALESAEALRANELPLLRSCAALLGALYSSAQGDVAGALAGARDVIELCSRSSPRVEQVRFAWPLGARAARQLEDWEALAALVAMVDEHPIGHIPPVLRAGRVLARAWEQDRAGIAGAAESCAEAIGILRDLPNVYELGHALVDYAGILERGARQEEAQLALAEAREISVRLSCPGLAARLEEPSRAMASRH